MSEFKLEIITPERIYFSGMVEAAICPTSDGDIEILKGHQNLVAALIEDEIKLKINGEWITSVVSEGFFEVRPDEVVIFAQYCDDLKDYAEAEKKRNDDILKEKEEYLKKLSHQRHTDISLSTYIMNLHQNRKNINFK